MKNAGWVVGIALIVVIAVLLIGGAGMMGLGFGMMGPRMMGGYGAQGFGFNPFGAILSLVFWALIIGGVVLLVAWLVRASPVAQQANRASLLAPSGEGPLEILRTRYARGEITKEQFDAIRRDLEA